ncbi:hypothetical protein ACOSQ2_014115 [Xanthoceras sorbifolium]
MSRFTILADMEENREELSINRGTGGDQDGKRLKNKEVLTEISNTVGRKPKFGEISKANSKSYKSATSVS